MNVEKIEASKSVLQRDAENQNKGYEEIPQRRSNLGLKRRLYSALRVVLSIGALIALVCTFFILTFDTHKLIHITQFGSGWLRGRWNTGWCF